MSYALVSNTAAGGTSTTVTTAAIDTTGADLLVVAVSEYFGATGASLSDSKSNTWTQLTAYVTADYLRIRLYYCQAPTVGTGHTFTYSGTDVYCAVAVSAFTGSAATPADQQNGAGVTSATQVQPGSITPSENNCLVVSALAYDLTETVTVTEGMTITDQIQRVASEHFALGLAYKIQTTAAAINPTWSWTTAERAVATVASFKAAAASSAKPTYMYAQQ